MSQALRWEFWILSRRRLVEAVAQISLFLAIAATCVSIIVRLYPATTTMTTRHELSYLPAQYQLVKLTNVLQTGVGIGVGAPQVDVTVEEYRKLERPVVHYLDLAHSGSVSTLNYYDIEVGKVLHTSVNFPAPGFSAFGLQVGFFQGVSSRIERGELVIDRQYNTYQSYLSSVWVVAVGLILWFCLVVLLSTLLYALPWRYR